MQTDGQTRLDRWSQLGPEHSQEDRIRQDRSGRLWDQAGWIREALGSGRMDQGGSGVRQGGSGSREQGMRAAEAAWQQCLHPPASTSSAEQHPVCPQALGTSAVGCQQSLPWVLISVAPASGLGLPYPSFPDQSPEGCTAAAHSARICGCDNFELL